MSKGQVTAKRKCSVSLGPPNLFLLDRLGLVAASAFVLAAIPILEV
jgi:hypothetical protein